MTCQANFKLLAYLDRSHRKGGTDMKYLRTVSTQRLLALLAGLVAAIGAGTAIAVAASGSGPVPPSAPLAQAVHSALAAPSVPGISARITFTNHLIDATNIQGSDPILQGASGRLWLSLAPGDQRLRIELQSDNGDAQVVAGGGSFWAYDPTANTAYEGTLPNHDQTGRSTGPSNSDSVPSIDRIQNELDRLMGHFDLSGAVPSDVAGQAAYTVRISPKHDGGLLGEGQLAWDAAKGVPLRIALYARGNSTPVLELRATDISYGSVPASDFAVTPPSGAKVVKVSTLGSAGMSADSARRRHASVTGPAAVASRLPFALVDPSTLVGLPRRSVTLLSWGGSPSALVTYGQNLGGVAVLEQAAKAGAAAGGSSSGDHKGLNLPTVSINGATGQELDTALGTMVRFTRGGVTFTVVGSVPPSAADLAARGL
jgi:outer membrane lipoprotein-sorting protein